MAAVVSAVYDTSLSIKAVVSNKGKQKHKQVPTFGNFTHFGEAFKKDIDFMKKKVSGGVEWANKVFHVPQVSKTLDDLLWLRVLEKPDAPNVKPSPWPEPSYPALSGLDLLMADLNALEAYISYFYYLSRIWSKPLPEVYDPEGVAHYFSCRPHLIALRLLEVFSSFATAAIRIRASGISNPLGSRSYNNEHGNTSQCNFGLVLKETMLSLGPTFIKVGQSLSTRPDIIGAEISKALSGLHDQIPPFPQTAAMQIIEEELGSPVKSFFSYISDEPVAAASFGQVYRGNTVDGFDVAVKVQRPNLCHVVVRDIYILRLGLGLVQKIAKRKSDLRLYADELGKGLMGELDYTLEATNASEFLEAHSSFNFIRVPKVLRHLTRKRVLTMEWIAGDSPTNLFTISTGDSGDSGSAYSEDQRYDAKRRLLDLVNKGVEASLIQLLETGLLHADPHPGNLRYTSSGQICFLDFGLLCRMQRRHQYAMLASIVHIVNGDWSSLLQALIQMEVVRPGTNLRRVTLDLEYALGEVEIRDGIPDVKFSRVLGKIWSIALKYHFRMPTYYTLVLRSLASLEGLAVAGNPNFKTFEAAYPYVVRKLLTENTVETREILHSVLFTKRKEFRWDRLALFMRVGATRKDLQSLRSSDEASLDFAIGKNTDVFDIASLVLRLLPSKDGVVLRRLLMTADGTSLIRAMLSKEAAFFQQQLCSIVADIFYEWMSVSLGYGVPNLRNSAGPTNGSYISLLRDRRLKVIAAKALGSAKRDTLLMVRLCWVSFVMALTASAVACHRIIVDSSEAYFGALPFPSKRYAIAAA